MGIKANVKAIEALRPRAERYDESVIGRPGLVVRIWPSGKRTAFHRFKIGSQSFKVKLGEYGTVSLETILASHAKQRQKLTLGENPAAEAQRHRQEKINNPTIRELAELYLERHARPNKRTANQDELMLKKDVISRWGKLRADTITRADVKGLVEAVIARGAHTQARKTLAVTKSLFAFAIDNDILSTDPTLRITVKVAPPRDRSLSDAEIGIFWNGLTRSRIPEPMRDCLRLQLLLGQRIGEITGMAWQEIDLEAKTWRIPVERSKNKKSNLIPLTPAAVAILESYDVKPVEKWSAHVFSSFSKAGHLLSTSVAHALSRDLQSFIGLDGNPIPPFTTHDLRRTTATGLASLGVPRLIIDRLLNHADRTVTRRHYDTHTYINEMRDALDVWARKLDQLVKGKLSNVTPLRRRERKSGA